MEENEVTILTHMVKVCSFQKKDISLFMHQLIDMAFIQRDPHLRCRFFSFTETTKDYSLLMDVKCFEALPKNTGKLFVADHVWIPLVISAGPNSDSGGISKIAKSVIIPLADEDISVYCVSTYQSDFVLVKDVDLEKSCAVLGRYYRIVRGSDDPNVEEETIMNHPYAKTPSTSSTSHSLPRPVTHELTMPLNTFNIVSMPPAMLSANALSIIELMFYASRGVVTSPNQEIFFSFVLVDGDVSIVIDADCFARFRSKNQLHVMKETWRMVKIGDMPDGLGFVKPGIVAQVSEPLADANIQEYYISSFYCGHVLVPVETYETVVKLLSDRQEERLPETPPAERAEISENGVHH